MHIKPAFNDNVKQIFNQNPKLIHEFKIIVEISLTNRQNKNANITLNNNPHSSPQ